jgi:hypothetical protein
MRKFACRGATTIMGLALVLQCGAAAATEIRVLYPPPMHTVLAELLPRFERISGHRITAIREPSAAIIAHLARRANRSSRQSTGN